jgi:hypothetical protein
MTMFVIVGLICFLFQYPEEAAADVNTFRG